jgi:hypothetical protein
VPGPGGVPARPAVPVHRPYGVGRKEPVGSGVAFWLQSPHSRRPEVSRRVAFWCPNATKRKRAMRVIGRCRWHARLCQCRGPIVRSRYSNQFA